MKIDLNADLAEGFPFDAELMDIVTSANICCGMHAGGPEIMREALVTARHKSVRVGAHPGYADRKHFGRRELQITPPQMFEAVLIQIQDLIQEAAEEGVKVAYVKPHGAMYHQASYDQGLALAVVRAAKECRLAVMGLPTTLLESTAKQYDVPFIREGFADRRYRNDGSLVPRSEPDAYLTDPHEAAQQARRLVSQRGVQSICVHGDKPDALEFARSLREELNKQGVSLSSACHKALTAY
jgi:5-oxoprolinase (ATP-hydrolysing) subunit A